ncbi:hypothetical protein AUJ67_08340 [Candidatus Desantisbacteria bacterium CG1_02_49_89]|nr:MAG: hypothetical protein AUJ67_08340 [Candidatus Desantisbacteria bacterium CG1_02_49_89]
MRKIPKFKTEESEAKFWDEHSFVDFAGGLEETRADFPKPKKHAVPVLLEEGRIQALKQLASSVGIGYGTLVRVWIIERLKYEAAHLKQKTAV